MLFSNPCRRRYFSYREMVSLDQRKRFVTGMCALFLVLLDLDGGQEVVDLLGGVDVIDELTIFVAKGGKFNCE